MHDCKIPTQKSGKKTSLLSLTSLLLLSNLDVNHCYNISLSYLPFPVTTKTKNKKIKNKNLKKSFHLIQKNHVYKNNRSSYVYKIRISPPLTIIIDLFVNYIF